MMCVGRNRRIGQIVRFIILFFGIASIILFFYQSIRNHNYVGGNDLTSYLKASSWFFSGENPYTAEVRRYIYPLFLVVVSYPFTFLQSGYLSKSFTAACWSLLSYFAFFLTIFTSLRYLNGVQAGKVGTQQNLLFVSVLILLVHPFLQDEFLNGQVNLFVLGCTAGYFFMLQRRRSVWAALFLAVATSLKIAPGLCLLFVVFGYQYRTVVYFLLFVVLFTVAIPCLINNESLAYYRYFITEVMPQITGSDFEGGFKSFSVISTVSYVWGIHWYPPLKIAAVGILALGLFAPVLLITRRTIDRADSFSKFATFATVVSIIPLTFPMSESHHLLILTIPFLAIMVYWRQVRKSTNSFWRNRLSVWFFVSLAILHIGQGIKTTPLRLLGLIGIYIGMVMLLSKLKGSGRT